MTNKSKKYRKIKSKRTSKKNYKSSSSKRYYHKKLIGYKKNYLGGTRLITMSEVTLSNMIVIYFNLYRLMPWQKDKLFIREDIKKELNDYCSRLQEQEIQSRCETVWNLPNLNETSNKESSNCCILNGKRKTSKYSIKKFTNNSQILIDDYDITFVKQYDAISINNKALEVELKRKFIIDNWNFIDFTRLLKENLDTIQEIFDYYIVINNNFKNYDYLLDTIQSNSFFGIYGLFDLLTEDGFLVIDEDFKRQLQIIKQRIQPSKTQEYDNKLFSQKLEDGTEIKYIYFMKMEEVLVIHIHVLLINVHSLGLLHLFNLQIHFIIRDFNCSYYNFNNLHHLNNCHHEFQSLSFYSISKPNFISYS
jgi:hypothetical protein